MSDPCLACMNDAVLGYKSPLPFCALCGARRNKEADR